MLVISRKKGEAIQIGDGPNQLTVIVTEIRTGSVRIGVEAPREIPVVRVELLQQDKAESDDV